MFWLLVLILAVLLFGASPCWLLILLLLDWAEGSSRNGGP